MAAIPAGQGVRDSAPLELRILGCVHSSGGALAQPVVNPQAADFLIIPTAVRTTVLAGMGKEVIFGHFLGIQKHWLGIPRHSRYNMFMTITGLISYYLFPVHVQLYSTTVL
jgi:hypothetical protein